MNESGSEPEITDEMREKVQAWVDQGVETYGSAWAKLGIGRTALKLSTEESQRTLYPSEQRKLDRASRARLLSEANEYPEGRVVYLCLPENRAEALRLGLISPEDIE